jgi:hypothetical protein
MRDFIFQLEQQLIAADQAETRRPRVARFARSAAAMPSRSAATIAGAVAAVTLAALVGFPTSSSPPAVLAYPVLATPPTDASQIVNRIPAGARQILIAAGAAPRQARPVSTPWGTGYAMPTTDGRTLCLATPDRYDRSWAASCGGGVSSSGPGIKSGLGIMMEDRGRAEAVDLLPAGATDPVVRYANGTTKTIPANEGVSAIEVRQPATITYRVGKISWKVQLAPLGYCIPRPLGC